MQVILNEINTLIHCYIYKKERFNELTRRILHACLSHNVHESVILKKKKKIKTEMAG